MESDRPHQENVTSHNQSGGITAHTVTSGGGVQAPAPAPKNRRKPFWQSTWFQIVILLAAIATVLAYLQQCHQGKAVEKVKSTQVSVTSINQSGGITAHTVNLGPPQRSLSGQWGEGVKAELLTMLPRDKKIRLITSAADTEAARFATEILEFMREHQFDLWADCVLFSLAGVPPRGLVVNDQGFRVDVIVGTSV